jgi:hypothetical protein
MLSSPNQVLSALSMFNEWARRAYRTACIPFYMTKDKTPKQLAEDKEAGNLITEMRDLHLGDWHNRNGNIYKFKDDLFGRMISNDEAMKILEDTHNSIACDWEAAHLPAGVEAMDITGTT